MLRRTVIAAAISGCLLSTTALAQTLDAQMQRMNDPQAAPTASPSQAAPSQWPVLKNQPATKPAPAKTTPATMAAPVAPVTSPAPAAPEPAFQQPALYQQMPAQPEQPQPYMNVEGAGAIPALPLEVMQSPAGVQFVNGGIGDEEMDQLKSVANQYNVQILLNAPGGAYVSDVTLRLSSEQNQPLLEVRDAGPHLFVMLPPGSYNMETFSQTSAVKKVKFRVPATGIVKQHVVVNE